MLGEPSAREGIAVVAQLDKSARLLNERTPVRILPTLV